MGCPPPGLVPAGTWLYPFFVGSLPRVSAEALRPPAAMEDQSIDCGQWPYDDDIFDFSTPVAQGTVDSDSSPEPPSQSQRRVAARNGHRHTRCCAYAIKWAISVTAKKRPRTLTENTIQGIDSYPSAFWETNLRSVIEAAAAAENLVENHTPSKTQIVFSITERGIKDIPLYFPLHNVIWQDLDKQIDSWSDFVNNRGRALTLKISFIFKEQTPQTSTSSSRRGATRRQFEEREALLNDPETTNEYDIWDRVVHIIECPGNCKVGPYCWPDPETQKRYPLDLSMIEDLVDYVTKGGRFETYDDMPPHLRKKIRGEERPTKRKRGECPPIQIINNMPGAEDLPMKRSKYTGPMDNAINKYRDWLCSKVADPDWRDDILTIAELTYKGRFDLNTLCKEDVTYFVSKGVEQGLARQWVVRVDEWKEELEEED